MPYSKNIQFLWSILLLITLPAIIYWQVLDFQFLNIDDNRYVVDNPYLQPGVTWSGFKWAWSTFGDPYYMPVTRLSYLFDVGIHGINPFGFHLTNLALHIANTLLVFWLLFVLSHHVSVSLITALLFAVHPQHVEAVAWVAQRKELLAAFFGLLSLISYVRHVNQIQSYVSGGRYQIKHYLLSLLFFLMSLLSKPTWITLPVLLMLLDWWPLQRIKKAPLTESVTDKVPYFLLAGFFIIIHSNSAGTGHDYVITSSSELPFVQRVANSLVIYTTYFWKTFIPLELGGYQPYPMHQLPGAAIMLSGVVLFLLSSLAFFFRQSQPGLFMGWLWYLTAISPMVGVIGFGESVFTGDRWTYLPHIGLFAAVIWTLFDHGLMQRFRMHLYITIISVIALLSFISWDTSKSWQNPESYWLYSINITEDNHYAHWKLAAYYESIHKPDQALIHYLNAYRIKSNEPYYALSLGNIYLSHGYNDLAWQYYDDVLTTAPADLLVKMGLMSIINGEHSRAEKFFGRVMANPSANSVQKKDMIAANLFTAHIHVQRDESELAVQYLDKAIEYTRHNGRYDCDALRSNMSLILRQPDVKKTLALLDRLCKPN